ncbi:MAG TPA: thioredoxin domain-containing protein [Proteobacteria bacterium]|nr:glycosyl hydrolase family 76 [bacterium BMS3Abin14]HDL53758.1 thioredoxin domain-containing protein [Pseudomonadota bacterium]
MENYQKRRANRLIYEKSPYLIDHAHNPVDWYPWGPEAFTKAAYENRPIFLSIGYSACHWCHVMAMESFNDPEVAALLNRDFISIKVDREERPDLDHIYMAACQCLTGGGGWPLTIIMTPARKPFFAGTYFPRTTRFGRTGMIELIPRIADVWKNSRGKTLDAADKVLSDLENMLCPTPGETPDSEVADRAFEQMYETYDSRYGGFGEAPKFPSPGNILFLLKYWWMTGAHEALSMAEMTLQTMRRGGIYDHVGHGFHRYSTDEKWFVPHFEKMLYDQALMVMAYTDAYQATGKKEYQTTARQILSYVLRDMTDKEGAFYSAEDADSEGKEGRFYTWTWDELKSILSKAEFPVIGAVFRISKEGNYSGSTGHANGQNILHMEIPLPVVADRLNIPLAEISSIVEAARLKLLETREDMIRPHRDEKVLTDWNGLMIAALAKAAAVFGERKYALAAEKAARFILKNLREKNGQLLHSFYRGHTGVAGNIDDYAFFLWGLVELYQSTFKTVYLSEALNLAEQMLSLFWDDKSGGFFFTCRGHGPLAIRHKTAADGATPSGNAVAAMNLLRLGRLTATPRFEEMVAPIGRAFSGAIRQHPSAHATYVSTIALARGPGMELVITGDQKGNDTMEMICALRSVYLPNMVAVFVPVSSKKPRIVSIAPYVKAMRAMGKRATAYVCQDYICQSPVRDAKVLIETLRGAGKGRR